MGATSGPITKAQREGLAAERGGALPDAPELKEGWFVPPTICASVPKLVAPGAKPALARPLLMAQALLVLIRLDASVFQDVAQSNLAGTVYEGEVLLFRLYSHCARNQNTLKQTRRREWSG